ncbi:autorepressor SdpR family transcription factor [Phosphitispora sp. TUW77]|uniref:autorepressor SdpR family transcription factor n=1 Tax=Phosphitispora sp. TUW77 TaxID=3152361 RepID=UPI003AB4F8B9
MDKTFKALSDKTRRKILKDLKERNMSAGDIADRFDISKPSISHHLDILKNAGLVLSEKQGQYVIYSLNTSIFQDVMAWFLEFSGENQVSD